MTIKLEPKEFGLPARTVIGQIDENTIALIIDRKSRIIMADGKNERLGVASLILTGEAIAQN